jgi:hypothetical protein
MEAKRKHWSDWAIDGMPKEKQLLAEYTWNAAVAAERAKWKLLTDDSKHIFNGGCPEQGNWNGRDPECQACVLLGEWQA